MNPYMRWTDGGKTFVCNFCGHSNPCPDVYFNYLGPDGRCVTSAAVPCRLQHSQL
jgi:protein transport protein SEC24